MCCAGSAKNRSAAVRAATRLSASHCDNLPSATSLGYTRCRTCSSRLTSVIAFIRSFICVLLASAGVIAGARGPRCQPRRRMANTNGNDKHEAGQHVACQATESKLRASRR